MKVWNQVSSLVFGIILLVVLLVGGVWLWIWFAAAFSEANASVQAAIIAGLGAVTISLLTFWRERSRSIREAHREKKIEVYSAFLELLFGMVELGIQGKEVDESHFTSEQFLRAMFDFKRNVLIYGSPRLIKAFNRFTELSSTNGSENPFELLGAVEEMFYAIRADLGLSNQGLGSGDLHRLYVTDYNEAVLAKRESK